MIPLYEGKRDIYSFLEFYETVKDSMKSKGLSQKEIQLIKDAYPNHELPAQYVAFLEVAGKEFIPWQGSDYSIIDGEGYFNMVEHIHNDEDLEELYKKHGFTDENSCVFLSHQGYAFYIFKLDESDNPEITYLDSNYEYKGKSSKSYTFADYVIDSYNEEAYYINKDKNPWQDASFGWYDEIRYICSYREEEKPLIFYVDYDYYSISRKIKDDFIKLLAPILFESFEERINKIYVYQLDKKNAQWYRPHLDEKFETPTFMNAYKERSFFWRWQEDNFGWIVNEGKVYIFGEKFRKLIEEKAEDFGLVKIGSGKASERT